MPPIPGANEFPTDDLAPAYQTVPKEPLAPLGRKLLPQLASIVSILLLLAAWRAEAKPRGAPIGRSY
jgi:hypothetical protein